MIERRVINRALLEIGIGTVLFAVAVAITIITMRAAIERGGVYVIVNGPMFVGTTLIALGLSRFMPKGQTAPAERPTATPRARADAALQILVGFALIAAGCTATYELSQLIGFDLPTYVVGYMLIGFGALVMGWGLWHFLPSAKPDAIALEYVPGIGYRSFVAWRYLLNRQHRVTVRTKLACSILVLIRLLLWEVFDVGVRFAGWYHPLHVIGIAALALFVVILFFGVIRHSRLAAIVFLDGLVTAGACWGIMHVVQRAALGALPGFDGPLIDLEVAAVIIQTLQFVMLGGLGFSLLAGFFGTLRAFFTFFTTVPIGGVWIGTAALVLVLAVMSGFETDLRDKILGSNAHIQVTREDGDFVDWRVAKDKIDKIDGVKASTPYAVSEVVIAANNNGQNVIIKGIDPDTVAKVTDLVDDLEDPDAMRRMQPLVKVTRDTTVTPRQKPAKIDDPPPDDMVTGGDPIDFSGTPDNSGSGSGSAVPTPPDSGSGSGSGSGSAAAEPPPDVRRGLAGDPDVETLSPYGGDASRIIDLGGGNDWLWDTELLRWFIGDHGTAPGIHAVDIPLEPSLSRRTQALPGILVGRELVKQTHLYTGEEVRVVSPLSDPSNPDATGTPIPFNRDYRVAGVFYTGMYEYDLKFVYVTLDSLQDFLDLGDTVDGIEVRVGSPDDTARYVPSGDGKGDNAGLIRQALGPGYRVQDWRELNRSLFSALKLEKIAMFLVLGIVILVASFSIIGNLIMVVVEKAREIALLKTLGASDTGVMQLFAVQGLIIGLIGTTLGVLTGLAGCLVLEEFGLPLDPDVYYINRLPIHVDTQSVIAAAITGVLISIAATLYPALLAARVRPADGMRH